MLRPQLMVLLFPAFALLAALLEAFGTLSIPLLTLPSLILFGAFALLGLAVGGVAVPLLPNQRSHVLRHVLFVASLVGICLVVLDVALQGHRLLSSVADTRIGRLGVIVALSTFLFGVLWIFRRQAVPVLFVGSSAFFISTVLLNVAVLSFASDVKPVPSSPATATSKPPIVYMIIDGGMGVEGLRVAPDGERLAADLRQVFEDRGFRVYGRAFSRHFVSGRSIPNTLNFDFQDNTWGPVLRHHKNLKVRSLLFENLAKEGYEIVSYGTEHIDFCFAVATRCEVLPSFNPFSPFLDSHDVKSNALIRLVSNAFRESYILYRASRLLLSLTNTVPPSQFAGFDAYAFPRWFDRFDSDVTSSPRGRAYFAHLLMPHAPYVFDSECRETGKAVVAYFLQEDRNLAGAALDIARRDAYRDYRQQYRCLLRRLDRFLTRIDSLPDFRDATIVVHGDHGPRISAGQYAENLSDRDLVDNYSALYAIRRPDVAPGYDLRKSSVQRLTAEYFGSQSGPLGRDSATVAVDSRDRGRVVVHPMPDFSVAAVQAR